jgi:putative phosphoribosyl transferase
MAFTDRVDAGRQLAARLIHLKDAPVVVLGLPRGGVPVAAEVARSLGAPLDVIVVRKLGVPYQPELAMGAIGEDGVRILNPEIVSLSGITPARLAELEEREQAELQRRIRRYRGDRPRVPLDGQVAVVVDDGIATGSTARAACQVARALGAGRVVLATPVAPPGWQRRIGGDADEMISVITPEPFYSIGQFYRDFSQMTDDQVAACLASAVPREPAARAVEIGAAPVTLPGTLTVPEPAAGVIAFAHGSGSSRHSRRNQYVAGQLHEAGFATLLFDLLTPEEERDRRNVFDIGLLSRRLRAATAWLRAQPGLAALPAGLFGASTGAAAALEAAAEPDADIAAVVSRGGRPDLAWSRLPDVRAPTLLIVGGRDETVLELNRSAQAELRCENELAVVPGATHLFEEPGALEAVAGLARDWFTRHLRPGPGTGGRSGPGYSL